jgi:hypothetical protein
LAADCAFCGLSSGPCFSGVSSRCRGDDGDRRRARAIDGARADLGTAVPAPRRPDSSGGTARLLHGLSRGPPKEQREPRHARFCRGRTRAIAQPSMSSGATSASVEEEKSRAGPLLVVPSERGGSAERPLAPSRMQASSAWFLRRRTADRVCDRHQRQRAHLPSIRRDARRGVYVPTQVRDRPHVRERAFPEVLSSAAGGVCSVAVQFSVGEGGGILERLEVSEDGRLG